MKHKAKLIILIILICMLILSVTFVAVRIATDHNVPEPTERTDSIPTVVAETQKPATVPATDPVETTVPVVTDPPTEPPTEPTEPTVPETQRPEPKPTTPVVVKPTYIHFPYPVSASDLEIQNIMNYDGVFLEDGSDRDVAGIAAMILVNRGNKPVEFVEITLMQDGRQLKFTASDIPAKSTIVVMEETAAAYSPSGYYDVKSNVAVVDKLEMSESYVRVEEQSDGSLRVTNLTNQTIPCIRIFYKFALEKGKIYVGGITYTAKITQLEAGSAVTVTPSHYKVGSSEVMMVRIYATAD